MKTQKIETLLEQEISEDLEGLQNLELGSEEYKVATEKVTKLMDKAIELKRIEFEFQKEENRKFEESTREENRLLQEQKENQLKQEQLNVDKKHRWIQHGLTIITFIGGILVTVWGTNKTLKFEETGTVTTSAGRAHIGNLFRKK